MKVDEAKTAEFGVVQQLAESRHSVRGFLPRPVESRTIGAMLDVAQKSASWCNVQPWEVIVTSGEATEQFREGLSAYAASHKPEPDFGFPASYDGVYRDRRRDSGWSLYEAVGIERGDREASARQTAKNFTLFGAPHTAIVTTDRNLGVPGAIDCGVWLGTFLMAAESLGVATIPQAALAMHPTFVRQHFGIDDSRLVVFGVSFGYEDAEHPANQFRLGRASLDESAQFLS